MLPEQLFRREEIFFKHFAVGVDALCGYSFGGYVKIMFLIVAVYEDREGAASFPGLGEGVFVDVTAEHYIYARLLKNRNY